MGVRLYNPASGRFLAVDPLPSGSANLATREVIGWAMADHHRAELPVVASRMAAGRGQLEERCIMHTDSERIHQW